MRPARTYDWDHLLQCLHLDQYPLEYKNENKVQEIKNNHVQVRLGQIMDNVIWRDQNPNCHFWRAGGKSKALCAPPAHNITKEAGKPPQPPLQASPGPPLLLFSHNKSFKSCLTLCDTTENSPAHQAPLSTEFPRQQILEWTDTFFSRSSWQPCCHPI